MLSDLGVDCPFDWDCFLDFFLEGSGRRICSACSDGMMETAVSPSVVLVSDVKETCFFTFFDDVSLDLAGVASPFIDGFGGADVVSALRFLLGGLSVVLLILGDPLVVVIG